MMLLRTHTFRMLVLVTGFMLAFQAMAQSTQDMSLLTEQENAAFSKRLQNSPTSAVRAKITAEMNRLIQERRMDMVQQKHAAEAAGEAHKPK